MTGNGAGARGEGRRPWPPRPPRGAAPGRRARRAGVPTAPNEALSGANFWPRRPWGERAAPPPLPPPGDALNWTEPGGFRAAGGAGCGGAGCNYRPA